MRKVLLLALLILLPLTAFAGPAEDANAAIDRWSAAYNNNDPEEVAKTYWSDAIVLGTVSPVMSEGADAIRKYFSVLKGSGYKSAVGERRTIVLGDSAVVVTGFYELGILDGKSRPSRFTMLIVKRDGIWNIAHHHSSPHVQPKK